MSLTHRRFVWAVMALLGIAVAAALTWSVTDLAVQRIGLSSEPLSVIHGLAPAHPQRATRPKLASSQGDGESSRATLKPDGPPPSPPAPVGTPSASPSVPPPPPAAATGTPATAALRTSSSPSGTAQAPSVAAAGAAATLPGRAGDRPDDSGAPDGGSHGHSGRDD